MKPKIIFFTESMSIMGGMERVTEFLMMQLSSEYDVELLLMDEGVHPDLKINSKVQSLDIGITPDKFHKKICRYIKTLYALNKFLKETDVQYFVANSPALSCSSGIVSLFLCRKNIKFIMFEHNKFDFPGRFWKWIRAKTFPYSYKVIALTQDAHNEYLKINSPSVHIPNAITIPIGKESDIVHKKMVAVGRLTDQKGFDNLLKAWKMVSREFPDWTLEIVGDGPDKKALMNLSKKLDIKDNVIFYGKSSNIQERYQGASGFILSSRYEGFCLVMIEAMAHGLPCISFDCKSGPSEVIEDEVNGYLVEDQSVEELARKIQKYIALNDEKKRGMSIAAKQTSQRYLPENIIAQWKEKVFKD
ncbi:hypothetical protein B9T11_04235 [Wohlfahrtiimonas chitiniclastica]|uniref:glycosyltransferase family 4 protein n=1 Tax=Wohlfahrtiimonas chitiniclastica TaxID=400946 RepID=UPI000B989C5F|nr:glycosyltransferase family 4 protein [Wohlfahrtiimonas chitiniclastica]MBS7814903.1 glycosyltransferase family 4 protein [Wohlfahrtiimonas chitiniclastica]MBS7826700.1 glycosyltransferase family 4 protein [Wohlfahrtiimonas chitiniclastica]OYQ82227.1 hypothetical protein B9T11_04235 [Wohlfahrtiimonas chitiniclastica]OYQ83699.1 hypothetical protein B9T14_05630 [Wohlfahrtiimonas chitiniclastica]OYQ84534.1 hypothetical protein B9T15_05645 [Wohlfahrtiimonas chitiniclastica]